MRTTIHRIRTLVVACIVLVPAIASAQLSASATSASNAQIIRGIGILRTQDLWFGDLLSPLNPGTVTVTAAGVRTVSAGITSAGGVVSPASFTVNENATGTPKFWVQLPVSATITRAGGGATMTVTNFSANVDPRCISTSGATPPGPQGQCPNSNNGFTLNVGAQLNVGASQMAGAYAGLFNVTVHRW